MKIGYLHIGAPQHGISRYGRMLATEARSRSALSVIEAEVVLTGERQHDRALLVNAAKDLSQADMVHLQYNRFIWGKGWAHLNNLNTFLRHCSCPKVVTLHDIFYPPTSLKLVQKYLVQSAQNANSVSLRDVLKSILQNHLSPNILALQKIVARSHWVFVCTQEEARRLSDRVALPKVRIVPHFVETRQIQMTQAEARRALDLEGFKVITLLGFIYSGKGHQLLVKVLTQLPQNFKVIFAGGVSDGHEAFFQTLMELAEAEGVRDRIRVTGYLSEAELERYLVATDLAVCPFRQTSASGSLSTWISAARPILASHIPQVAEYNTLEPNAIKTFEPYDAIALFDAIKEQIPLCRESDDPAVSRLRQQLSMTTVFDQHLNDYRLVG